ncbi:nucleotidyltransferase family protein [Candidatus Berkelbacteria bacterium]|nr:nucleotidyltransferase family protein [Candidatus Berkelbacteria bacterium]
MLRFIRELQKFTVVILCGGTFKGKHHRMPKCLHRVGGIPLFMYALNAARGCPWVGRIIVLADDRWPEFRDLGLVHVVSPGKNVVLSIQNGVHGLPPDDPVLIVSGDQPGVTAEGLTHVRDRCLCYPDYSGWYCFLAKERGEEAWPGHDHTYAHLAEGTFFGTGVGMLRPRILQTEPLPPLIAELAKARKSVLKLAWLLGPKMIVRYLLGLTLMRYLFGRPSIAEAQLALSTALGFSVAPVELGDGRFGCDADDPDDLAYANECFLMGSIPA